MQVFTEGEPLSRIAKTIWHGCCQPEQLSGPVARMQPRSGTLVNRLGIQLLAELRNRLARTTIFPDEYGCKRLILFIDPDKAMPESIGGDCRYVRGQVTRSRERSINGLRDHLDQRISLYTGFALA